MNNVMFPACRYIHAMRFIRPTIDCGLLVLGLFLFMYFDRISLQHEARENRPQRMERTLKAPTKYTSSQQKPTSLAQHFSSESAMWSAFSLWLQTTNMASGQCRFEIRSDLKQEPYMLQCGASAIATNNNQVSDANTPTLFAAKVLVTPEKISRATKQRKSTTEETEEKAAATVEKEDPMRVSGWINTPSGRRFFDPASNRWLP